MLRRRRRLVSVILFSDKGKSEISAMSGPPLPLCVKRGINSLAEGEMIISVRLNFGYACIRERAFDHSHAKDAALIDVASLYDSGLGKTLPQSRIIMGSVDKKVCMHGCGQKCV